MAGDSTGGVFDVDAIRAIAGARHRIRRGEAGGHRRMACGASRSAQSIAQLVSFSARRRGPVLGGPGVVTQQAEIGRLSGTVTLAGQQLSAADVLIADVTLSDSARVTVVNVGRPVLRGFSLTINQRQRLLRLDLRAAPRPCRDAVGRESGGCSIEGRSHGGTRSFNSLHPRRHRISWPSDGPQRAPSKSAARVVA